MIDIKNLVVIGSGNVAWHMINAFTGEGIRVAQVLARNKNTSRLISERFRVPVVFSPDEMVKDADLYLLTVQDDKIRTVAGRLGLTDQILVHTSGFTGMEILKSASSNIGVIWPLQTLTAGIGVNYREIPFFIEANSEENEKGIRTIVEKVSGKVFSIDSQSRQKAHLAAVIASNLTNHLYAISASILERENIPFEVLGPLITETAAKVSRSHPLESQTGPAARKDLGVIEKHLELLREESSYRDIYRMISENIIHHHNHKK